jgi:hypothetical protein
VKVGEVAGDADAGLGERAGAEEARVVALAVARAALRRRVARIDAGERPEQEGDVGHAARHRARRVL